MAAVESGEIASPAEMKRDGTDELQASPANFDPLVLDDDDELLVLSLQYDLSMRLIVAHQIQTLKRDKKKEIVDIHRSLLRNHGGESDMRRCRMADCPCQTVTGESDDDIIAEEEEESTVADAEEEEEESIILREFRDMYAKANDVARRYEEKDDIVWEHYDPDLEDNEARMATVVRLWRRLEKEHDDRAEAVIVDI